MCKILEVILTVTIRLLHLHGRGLHHIPDHRILNKPCIPVGLSDPCSIIAHILNGCEKHIIFLKRKGHWENRAWERQREGKRKTGIVGIRRGDMRNFCRSWAWRIHGGTAIRVSFLLAGIRTGAHCLATGHAGSTLAAEGSTTRISLP